MMNRQAIITNSLRMAADSGTLVPSRVLSIVRENRIHFPFGITGRNLETRKVSGSPFDWTHPSAHFHDVLSLAAQAAYCTVRKELARTRSILIQLRVSLEL
jgi:hypothetical protein